VALLVIQHQAADFSAWKKAFDSDPAGRAEHGVTRHGIYRPTDDPSHVVIHLEFKTAQEAQDFLDLPALRAAWQGFGVDPETHVLEDVEVIDY
jgi:heme-degrading monooxygenase HmoA